MVAKWSINYTYFLKNEFFLFLLVFVSVEIWVILTSILIFKKIGLKWLSIPVFCIWKCFFSVCVSTLREFSRFWYIALSLRWEKNYFPDSAYIVFTFLHCNSQILQTIWTHMLNNAFTSFLNVDFYLVKLFVTFHYNMEIISTSHSNSFLWQRAFREEKGTRKRQIYLVEKDNY